MSVTCREPVQLYHRTSGRRVFAQSQGRNRKPSIVPFTHTHTHSGKNPRCPVPVLSRCSHTGAASLLLCQIFNSPSRRRASTQNTRYGRSTPVRHRRQQFTHTHSTTFTHPHTPLHKSHTRNQAIACPRFPRASRCATTSISVPDRSTQLSDPQFTMSEVIPPNGDVPAPPESIQGSAKRLRTPQRPRAFFCGRRRRANRLF